MSLNLKEQCLELHSNETQYKYVGRNVHPQDTIVKVGNVPAGGDNFTLMAGPCSVESLEQLMSIASGVKEANARILRGGAFKPRTSPYSFQGLGAPAIDLLLKAKEETGLPIVSEIMDKSQLELFKDVDLLQVGAKNMQNFSLLKALGRCNKPVLLKRGFASTIEELLFSAEYIISNGNPNVILCERGIRTFETATRFTLDVSGIALLRQLTHLPVIADPSHSTGDSSLIEPASLAAVAAGAQGLLIEVHNNPSCALCDGNQAVKLDDFYQLSENIFNIRPFAYKQKPIL